MYAASCTGLARYTNAANKVLARDFEFLGVRKQLAHAPEWLQGPVEWTHVLSRFAYWQDLGLAYWGTMSCCLTARNSRRPTRRCWPATEIPWPIQSRWCPANEPGCGAPRRPVAAAGIGPEMAVGGRQQELETCSPQIPACQRGFPA